MRVLHIVWFFVLTIVLCVVNQASAVPSNAVEKAIKFLGKKFDKLIAAVNVIAYGKPTIKPGKFLLDYEKDSLAPVGDEKNR